MTPTIVDLESTDLIFIIANIVFFKRVLSCYDYSVVWYESVSLLLAVLCQIS